MDCIIIMFYEKICFGSQICLWNEPNRDTTIYKHTSTYMQTIYIYVAQLKILFQISLKKLNDWLENQSSKTGVYKLQTACYQVTTLLE